MVEILTRGYVVREGAVDEVVGEGEEGEVVETTEEGRERAVEILFGEVETGDRESGEVAPDPSPVARGRVVRVPVGEGSVQVF